MKRDRTKPHLSYRPGLDGLRALAVAGVFLYHSRIDWLPGGFLGVDLFFVLSGYLITSLLLVEWDARGHIDLRGFWLRRARRLFPAVVVVVLAALGLSAVFARDDLSSTRGDAISSLFYYTNWHEIIASHSYFTHMGRPSLLQHLWSLAVEEQFYVVWPLLLVAGLVLLGRRRLPVVVVAGIAGSAALMWLLYVPTNPSRVYYGTDTRAQLLLMGILLALVWPLFERIKRSLPLLELLGLAALGMTIYLFRTLQDFDPTFYRGGELAAAFCFAVLIAAVSHPASRLNEVVGWGPLRWVGQRSYGMYLWHWPVIELTRPGVDVPWTGPGVVVMQAGIVVIASALSYRFVEQPIRSGRLQQRLAGLQMRRRLEVVGVGAATLAAAFAVLFVTPRAISPVSLYTSPPPADAGTSSHHAAPIAHRRFWHEKHAGGKRTQRPTLPQGRILALGDSVMLGCATEVRSALRGRVRVDAVVGRQIADTVKDLDGYRSRHALPRTVVIQVGNNGPLWYADLVKLRRALRGVADVVIVTVRNDTSWQGESNHAIANWVRGWPQAHVADWYAHSTNAMLSDGTHPWPRGCVIYARVIANTLRASVDRSPA